MTLGLIEPTVDVDGRPAYRLSAALFSPDYTPNEALVARMGLTTAIEKTGYAAKRTPSRTLTVAESVTDADDRFQAVALRA